MWRTILVVAVVLIIFLFIAVNMHTTQVNLPFGKGFEIRTVFLLILSFLLGYGTAYFVGFLKNSKNRRRQINHK
jgi:uncharacterized integral membrane protein